MSSFVYIIYLTKKHSWIYLFLAVLFSMQRSWFLFVYIFFSTCFVRLCFSLSLLSLYLSVFLSICISNLGGFVFWPIHDFFLRRRREQIFNLSSIYVQEGWIFFTYQNAHTLNRSQCHNKCKIIITIKGTISPFTIEVKINNSLVLADNSGPGTQTTQCSLWF